MEKLSIENISVKLKEYRKNKKLTLQQMVELLDCEGCSSAGFLSEIERGIKKANASMVFAFEKLLGEDFNPQVKLIPVYATVPAGWPADCYVADEPLGYIPFEGNGRNMGALLVDGHSMSPDIKDGEYVVYVEDFNIRPGDRVVVLNEYNKPMVKEYALKNGEPWLLSVNPEYGNHKVNEHYRIIGRIIEVYSKRKIGRG